MKTLLKFTLLILIVALVSGCDQPRETVNSDQVSTNNLLRWARVQDLGNGTTGIDVYLQSSEWKTRSLDLGGATEEYHPDVVLNAGEYLEVIYDGLLVQFRDGAESPFQADFRRNYSPSTSYSVIFYRNSGEVVTIASN